MKPIGLIPAAGLGSRLSPLPFSKELFPLGYQKYNDVYRPQPVSQYLVESMKLAGVEDVFFVIHPSKTDILNYYSNGSRFGMNFSYLIQQNQTGLVEALAQGTPWMSENDCIFFGMPDTLFKPKDMFVSLRKTMEENEHIDILLALFPTDAWSKLGMTTVANPSYSFSEVLNIVDKPKTKPETNLAWGAAVWRKSFQSFLTNYLLKDDSIEETVLGDIFMAAKESGLSLYGTIGEDYVDTGTVEDLKKAIDKNNRF